MIDIGVNLTSSQFADEQADLVARARAAGVEALILTGTDLVGSHESATLAARWPGYCFSTAGVHPHDAKSVDE
ncbi:TatD family hydrolase, partial [Aeromonas dhakensis]